MTMWILMFHIWLLHYIFSFLDNTSLHSAWWCGMTHGHIYHYDDTCKGYNLTMMTWTSWWGGNANLSSLLLHIALLMIIKIYASYSWKVFFISYLHPPSGLWSLSKSFESSCNVFFLSCSMIYFMSSWFYFLFFISASVSLCFILGIYFRISLSWWDSTPTNEDHLWKVRNSLKTLIMLVLSSCNDHIMIVLWKD